MADAPPDPTVTLSPLKRALLALDDMKARLDAAERTRNEPIAIVGVGCRLPGGDGPEAFWTSLRDGVSAIREVPNDRWDLDTYYDADPNAPGKTYTRWGAFLDRVDGFDPQHFGIAPREAVGIDPQQRLLLEVAWEALEHAGVAPDRVANSATGVFVGICSLDYAIAQLQSSDFSRIDPYSASGNAHSIAAGRLSYVLGLKGPSMAVDTACSSSLVALHLACQSLRNKECRMALAGGVHLLLSPINTICFCKLHMLAADGRCKTFDAAGDGFVEGEGCGIVVLKRLSDALADGDRIVAVVRGSAVNQDGASSSLTAPNGPSQEAVIRAALESAGVSPSQVGYIEAHGTGTSLGDPIEVQALGSVFGPDRTKDRPLVIGSVKTNIGHTEAAAGIAGLIKLALALHHGEIPPHLHFRDPNPFIPWAELPIVVATERMSWPAGEGRRIGGISSFGFSGTNAHIVLEAPPAVEPGRTDVERPLHVMTLSARTDAALRELARRWGGRLATEAANISLADVAFTANVGRAQMSHRVALVADSREQLRAHLTAVAGGAPLSRGARAGVCGAERPRIAFLFTGQGAQCAGMGQDLYETQPTFRAALDRCADLLKPHLDRPLLEVLYPVAGSQSPIDDTAYAQPALFAFEYALAELWQSWGVTPAAVLGHSIGEYVAACVAGVFSVEDALSLVAARGRLMQALPRSGMMAAVFADETRVRAALAGHEAHASIAAINGPENVVLSGSETAVTRVLERLAAEGVRFERLTVSHAFHSPLMDPILDEFEQRAAAMTFAPSRITLISNISGGPARGEVRAPAYWRRHLREPVRFADGVAALQGMGYGIFLEIGPTATLSGMGRRLVPDDVACLPSIRKGGHDWRHLLETLAELYTRGIDIDWVGFDRDYARHKLTMPTYAFQRERYWALEATTAAPVRPADHQPRRTGAHPLLGSRLSSALRDVQYESALSVSSPAYLGDHRKHGSAVLPGTAFLEMGLAAARQTLGPGSHAVEEIVISEPLLLHTDATRVQTVLSPEGAGAAALRIFACDSPREEDEGERWRLHAAGTLRVVESVGSGEAERLATLKARCRETIDVEQYYARLIEDGHEYGAAFRGITAMWRGENEAIGRVQLPDPVAGQAGTYRVHPVLLDAAMQLLGASIPRNAEGTLDRQTYLPVSLGRVVVHADGASGGWSHVRLRPSDEADAAQGFTVDVRLYDDDGGLIAEVQEVHLRPVAREALQATAPREPWTEWLYELSWQPQSRALTSAADAHASGTWIILSDAGSVGTGLAQRFAQVGGRAVIVRYGPSYQVCEGRIVLDPSNPQHFEQMLADAAAADHPLRGVLHLWNLDADDPASESDAPSLDAAVRLGCGSLLHLVQGLTADANGPRPRLWVITRGAVAVGAVPRDLAVSQAPAWGLARTIVAEQPDLKCACIDLDPQAPAGELDQLWTETSAPGAETQVAFRQHERHVARLVRSTLPAAREGRGHDADEPVALEIRTPGILDNLELRSAARRMPGPGEVEVRVSVAGLNFRDVLNALGVYEGEPGPLGAECAGTVTAVGPDVEHLAIGDEVFGMAAGAFRTFVTTAADAVVRRPDWLGAEDAATIPATFLTAEYALNRLARMRRGERVLIHAAAGGVGLAAVQLAQRAGAEIFATAGSPEKRAFLQGLGVRHVMSSRSLDFAEEISARTAGEGVDIVLNSLAGDFIEKSLSTLRAGGRFLEIGRAGIWDRERMRAARPEVEYFPIYLGEVDLTLIQQMLRELVDAFSSGELTPLPRRSFALADAVGAFRFMAQARHIGKIVLAVDRERLSPDAEVLRSDARYLITGGLGALGLRVARWMVDGGARHLVLTGRTAPGAEARDAISDLQRDGADVMVVQADVSRETDVIRVLDAIGDRIPALRGIVHAAGTIDDGVLVQQTWPRFETVLAPKVAGAWNLHRQTKDRDLDFFVMFSSMASLFGAAGQGNYAAANAFLDALAHYRRAAGQPALSVNWGPWEGAGMVAGVGGRNTRRWRERGVGAIPPDDGVTVLGRLLQSSPAPPAPQSAVLPIDWSALLRQYPAGGEPPLFSGLAASRRHEPAPATVRRRLTREIEASAPNRRRHLVAGFLREAALRVLGLDPATAVDTRQPLRELGLDSLMAVELRNAIADALERTLPATLLFRHPTLDALCEFVLTEAGGAADPPRAAADPAPDTDAAAVEVRTLSDEDARRLLADELQSLAGSEWLIDKV